MFSKRLSFIFTITLVLGLNGCTTLVTAPIDITGSVVSATFNMVGAAGGAVVNTVTGGDDDDDED